MFESSMDLDSFTSRLDVGLAFDKEQAINRYRYLLAQNQQL